MRIRTKVCNECKIQYGILYRCRYNNKKFWNFLCKSCLERIKKLYLKNYEYGGTWKSKKVK